MTALKNFEQFSRNCLWECPFSVKMQVFRLQVKVSVMRVFQKHFFLREHLWKVSSEHFIRWNSEALLLKKIKFSIKDFFSKCDQISRKLRIWSHLLKKSLMENLFFCAVRIQNPIKHLIENGFRNLDVRQISEYAFVI